jgi:hypothetical protein
MKWQLSKKQKEDLKEIGWKPTGFWFGLDWDYEGNALDIMTRFMGKKLPNAKGYDFIVIAYRKAYEEDEE